jgi:hypothetical protein
MFPVRYVPEFTYTFFEETQSLNGETSSIKLNMAMNYFT